MGGTGPPNLAQAPKFLIDFMDMLRRLINCRIIIITIVRWHTVGPLNTRRWNITQVNSRDKSCEATESKMRDDETIHQNTTE